MGDPPDSGAETTRALVLRLLPVWLLCLCAGGLYGWSALIAPLQAAFEVSTARTGLVFSYAIASFTAAVLLAPHIAPRVAAGRRLAGFGLAAALVLALAARADSYAGFVLWFSAGFGALSGAIYIAALGVAARSGRAVVATPVMVAGFGIGGAVFGPVWRLLDTAGWGLSGLWVLAAGLLVAVLLMACLMAWHAKTIPQAPPETTAAPPDRRNLSDATPPSPALLALIWAIFALGAFGGLMVLGLAARMMDAATASIALSSATLAGIAIANTAGRLSVAALNHASSPFAALSASVGIGALGLTLTLAATSPLAVGAGLCGIALGYGILASAVPTITRGIFGPLGFERVFGVVFTAWGVAGFLAPWIAGAIFDATGAFTPALALALATTGASGLATVVLARRYRA